MSVKDEFDFTSYTIINTSSTSIPDNPNLFDYNNCERIYPSSELSSLNEWEAIEYKFLNGYSIVYGVSYLTNETKAFTPFLLKNGVCIETGGVMSVGNARAFAHRPSSILGPSYEEYENDNILYFELYIDDQCHLQLSLEKVVL